MSESNTCPVCNKSLYRFNFTLRDNSSKEIVGKRLLNCSKFYNTSGDKKGNFLKKDKTMLSNYCNIFVGWNLQFI